MKYIRLIITAFIFAFCTLASAGGSNPGLYYGQIPTAAQWNSFFAAKLDYTPGAINTVPYWDGSGNLLNSAIGGDCTSAANLLTCTKSNGILLLGASGSSAIGYSASGVGAVTQTVQSKLQQSVSVKDFGAVGNGVTNDTAAFQSAITALQGQYSSTSKTLYIPSGIYLVDTGTLSITNSIRIVGESRTNTKIIWPQTTGNVFTITTPNRVELENIFFQQSPNVGGYTATSGSIIDISGNVTANFGSRIINCYFDGGYNHIYTHSAYGWVIDRDTFNGVVNQSLHVENNINVDGGDSVATNLLFSNGGVSSVAIYQVSSGGLKISNTKILGGLNGYQLQLASGAATSDLLISNTSIEGSTGTALLFQTDGGGSTFANILLHGVQTSGIPNSVSVNSSGINLVTISGCLFAQVSGIAVNLGGTVQNFAVTGNSFGASGGTAVGVSAGAGTGSGKIGHNSYIGFLTNVSNSGANVIDYDTTPVFAGLLTAGFESITGANTTTAQHILLTGTNTADLTNIRGEYKHPTLSGGATTTGLYATQDTTAFTPVVASVAEYGLIQTPVHNSAFVPSSITSIYGRTDLGSAALGGSVSLVTDFSAAAPNINAATTTNIGTFAGFSSANVSAGASQTITNIYAFQGLQSSGSGKWNAYMSGTANNAFAGNTRFGGVTAPVATVDVTGSIAATTSYGYGTKVLSSGTTPTIASGFGTSPSVVASNGTAAFTINVGTGGTASSGVVTMPAATTGWACTVMPNGAPQAAAVMYSAPTSTTSITITNYTASTGAALAWPASAVISVKCIGY